MSMSSRKYEYEQWQEKPILLSSSPPLGDPMYHSHHTYIAYIIQKSTHSILSYRIQRQNLIDKRNINQDYLID